MRLVFLGSPPFGTAILRQLLASAHDVVAVVTPPDRPSGRGRRVRTSPVAGVAAEAGVELLRPEATKDPSFVASLGACEPEILVVASYGEILRTDVLDLAPRGSLNVHSSLLPRWRGAAPIQRAILAGDEETGVSVQRMVLALDEGDVLLERRTPIDPAETAGELLARLAELGGEAIVEALDALEAGTETFTPQDPDQVTYAPKLTKDEGRIDWSLPALELSRQVRAFHPWPGSRTSLPDGRALAVVAAAVCEGEGEPGTLLADDSFDVATGDGALRLIQVKPAGKGAMDAAAFLRGARLEVGARLGEGPE